MPWVLMLDDLLDELYCIFGGHDIYVVGSNAINISAGFIDHEKDIDLVIIGLTDDQIFEMLSEFGPVRNKFNGVRICGGAADIWGEKHIMNYLAFASSQGYPPFAIKLD